MCRGNSVAACNSEKNIERWIQLSNCCKVVVCKRRSSIPFFLLQILIEQNYRRDFLNGFLVRMNFFDLISYGAQLLLFD